ncbi:MAG: N-acetylmuramoyl-L-alanine amidase [Spirochaetes bacterium]|nr:N-acetylmuramoyl-L-alanine amidase [Spirochaetota bacterium]
MKIIEQYIPNGHPNRPGKKLEALKAIVVHYTQNENPAATDTVNVKYIGRKYISMDSAIFEADGKTPFRYGSAHVFCDMDSVTLAIPLDEVAWGCGDRNFNGGQQRVAKTVFGNRQNYQSISVEICNNDAIKDSDADWEASVVNAKQWIIDFLKSKNLQVDVEASLNPQEIKAAPGKENILILRHYDITGKSCPVPFVANKTAWEKFVRDAAEVSRV